MVDRYLFFFFNDTATTEIYTLSLHDALPICANPPARAVRRRFRYKRAKSRPRRRGGFVFRAVCHHPGRRSEEHTSELQSRQYLVCRLLLEKKKNKQVRTPFLLTRLPRNYC